MISCELEAKTEIERMIIQLARHELICVFISVNLLEGSLHSCKGYSSY